MKITFIRNSSCNVFMNNYIDEEYKRIIEKLLSLGIQPTGNKYSDKATLRRYEIQKLKSELGIKGKGAVNSFAYLTISPHEIEIIKNDLKMNDPKDDIQNNIAKDDFENFTGSTQNAVVNQYFLRKKQFKNSI